VLCWLQWLAQGVKAKTPEDLVEKTVTLLATIDGETAQKVSRVDETWFILW
jgi:hypothetical protein